MAQPLVSVITIFLNGERFLAEAIESVLAQTFDSWELLLCDDGSSDDSPRIAREYAERYPDRIRYLHHEGHRNRGMSATRNLGASHARGAYLCLLDGDDVYLPTKLARQVAFMDAHTDVAMVFGPTEYWHSWTGTQEDAQRDYVTPLGLDGRDRFDPPELLRLVYPLGPAAAPCVCSLMIRVEAYRRVGGFEETFRGFYEDQGFLVKMYARERLAALDECLDRYRIHPDSCSAMVSRSGTYAAHRGRYLQWLGDYLTSSGVTDPQIARRLAEARQAQPVDDAPVAAATTPHWLKQLRVVDGNVAKLETSADNPDLLRLRITQASTAAGYDIQLNLPRIPIVGGRHYALSFLARSDRPRGIAVGCADTNAPWVNLGLYRELALTADWQRFDFTFVALRDQHDARIHIDAGTQAVSLEVSTITLRDVDAGRFVWSRLPGGATGQSAAYVSPGDVDFGSLRRVTPLSDDFGCDRGGPVDRYYIDAFLDANRAFVRGAVLEVGDRTYTRRFGGDRVTSSDVLHVTPGDPVATIIADLTAADYIPSNSFDCFIFTQTLQLIYDVPAALRTIQRILKPGGVVLATFPGISQTYDNDWGKTWYWNFTRLSARRLFEDAFGGGNVHLDVYGNVLSAASFLYGLAAKELTAEELDYRGAGYDVTIGARAVKNASGGPAAVAGDGTAAVERGSPAHTRTASAHARAVVLMYHRVAESQVDPWSLCVSPRHFEAQLDVVRRFATPVPLRDLAARLERSDLPDRAVVVTFDDGYRDNLTAALPLLRSYETPATIFATSGYVGGEREFWWDELEALLLTPAVLPQQLTLTVDGHEHAWDISSATSYGADESRRDVTWRAEDAPPSARHAAYLSMWRLLQLRPAAEQRAALDDLWRQAGRVRSVRETHRVVTMQELATLAADPFIEIGAHTVTHPALAELSPELQTRELVDGKAWLEQQLGKPVQSLAYPYGAHTEETALLARRAGYRIACATVADSVRNGVDIRRVPRVHVHDWAGPEFARHLSAWLA